MPAGDGTHYLVVKAEIREKAGAAAGDTVRVTMERDTSPRTVEVPEDLAGVLEAHPDAKQAFDKLSYSHQKAYVEWIEGARKAETRAGRLAKCIPMLREGRNPKG